MSLDVYLKVKGLQSGDSDSHRETSAIFIREDGQIKQISRDEWDVRFPHREPITINSSDGGDSETVYSANITHNLGKMSAEANIYQYLWRPEEANIEKAEQLIEPLRNGLSLLENEPERFKAFNPQNGWGSYKVLVAFVRGYLEACEKHPEARVSVWR